jgi:hypothetical protein
VFGAVNDLTLDLDAPLGQRRVFVQDLAGKDEVDVTGDVKTAGKSPWEPQCEQPFGGLPGDQLTWWLRWR